MKLFPSPGVGVPHRSWVAIPPRCIRFNDRGSDRREYERAVNDFPARIASLRRSCEVLRVHAASRSDYLRAVRLHEILAEASHLVSTMPPNSGS